MIEGGRPVGVAAGEAIGPYGNILRRYVVPFSEVRPAQPATTYLPYFVAGTDVAVLGRNNRSGLQVWSAEWGYPGDFDYREFHKKDGISGMQYWRVSGARVSLGDKDAYHPDWAAGKVGEHARHYAHLVGDLLKTYQSEKKGYGVVCANYDTELFGHWWFEGVSWIEAVLRELAASEVVDLTTAPAFVEAHPPETVLNLPEGSWGAGGTHFVWDNTDTHWMWPVIHAAERRMLEQVRKHASASAAEELVLKQAARELLLLQSSDWPFLVSTGQAREYAVQRFHSHVERFDQLIGLPRPRRAGRGSGCALVGEGQGVPRHRLPLVCRMRVLFLAAEASPLIKVGGLGDVAGELPPALSRLGIDIRVAIPRYAHLAGHVAGMRPQVRVDVPRPSGPLPAEVYELPTEGGRLWLVGGEPVERAPGVYGDAAADAAKFIFFALGALQACRATGWSPDVVHAHDWHTAPALAWLRTVAEDWATTAAVLTVHNLPFMGTGGERRPRRVWPAGGE